MRGLTLWERIACANDVRSANLLLRAQRNSCHTLQSKRTTLVLPAAHECEILVQFRRADELLGGALHLCCALGHCEMFELLANALAFDGDSSHSHLVSSLALNTPACVQLPLAINADILHPITYALAFNQHTFMSKIIPRVRVCPSSRGHLPAEMRIKGIPSLSNTSSTEPELSEQNKSHYEIEINEETLLEWLDVCGTLAICECAALLVDAFEAQLSTALHRLQRSNIALNRQSMCLFAIHHGPRLLVLCDPVEDEFLPKGNMLEWAKWVSNPLFPPTRRDQMFPRCPTATFLSIQYLIQNLQISDENQDTVNPGSQHALFFNECASYRDRRVFFCGREISMRLLLFKLYVAVDTILSGAFYVGEQRCSIESSVTALHAQLHVCKSHREVPPIIELCPQCPPSSCCSVLTASLRMLFAFERSNPALYMHAENTEVLRFRVPPVSLFFAGLFNQLACNALQSRAFPSCIVHLVDTFMEHLDLRITQAIL